MCAELEQPITSSNVDAILVAWSIPQQAREFCRKFNIDFVEKKLV
jgi:hypothetical protein